MHRLLELFQEHNRFQEHTVKLSSKRLGQGLRKCNKEVSPVRLTMVSGRLARPKSAESAWPRPLRMSSLSIRNSRIKIQRVSPKDNKLCIFVASRC